MLNIAHIKPSEVNKIASIMFDTLSINESDSTDVLLEKLDAIKTFRNFLIKHIDFNKLSSKKSKLEYIDFLDKINQQIEALELLSGQISQEQINTISENFSKKTDFPIGIYE